MFFSLLTYLILPFIETFYRSIIRKFSFRIFIPQQRSTKHNLGIDVTELTKMDFIPFSTLVSGKAQNRKTRATYRRSERTGVVSDGEDVKDVLSARDRLLQLSGVPGRTFRGILRHHHHHTNTTSIAALVLKLVTNTSSSPPLTTLSSTISYPPSWPSICAPAFSSLL